MSLGSIVNLAAGKIGELLVEEAKLLYGVRGKVESLRDELKMMVSFLKDKEEEMGEEGGDERTRTTIALIRKIAYDAEDVIESYIVEANSSDNKTKAFFRRYVFFCSGIRRRHQVASEIEAIKGRIGETTENWKRYGGENGASSNVGKGVKTRTRVGRLIAHPHNIEEHVVGLEEDINMLVKVLTADETHIKVVSIVGMGGSGKTTLARKLFHHEGVKKHFDLMAWVSISEQWDTRRNLQELLRKASGETLAKDERWTDEEIVEKLQRYLERKRYLIVLDDVWTKRALEEILQVVEPSTNDGRKIIVTTRKHEVNDFPDLKCFFHEPRRLTEDESWKLFTKIVLIHNANSVDNSMFIVLGKEMLKKCQGLPLAVVALAGILGKKETLEEWEKVKNSVSSRIMEQGQGTHLYGPVKEMLALSYSDLPCELKPCFLYLANFPEDDEISVGMLCRMWIAEGFIAFDQMHGGDTLEDVAREYLDELILRCVVQVAHRNYRGDVKTIRVHDLVRDLCIKKAKEQDFLEILSSNSNSDTIRRIAIHSEDSQFPSRSQHNIRSLVCTATCRTEAIEQLQTFKLLRVLLLYRVSLLDGRLPTEIGSLIHLRYLGIRRAKFNRLPSSIGNLRNLLTLEYRDIVIPMAERGRVIFNIPDVLCKLSSLRHLFLPHGTDPTATISPSSLKLQTLKHLQIARGLVGGSWMLEELPLLSSSVQQLDIRGIKSEEQLEAAFQCPSIKSDRLHSLTLGWFVDPWAGERKDFMLRNNLRPIVDCQHLRKLHLRGTIQERLNIQFPTYLNKVVLYKTRLKEEATLAGLGKLPNLNYLDLKLRSYKGSKWTCTAGEFPQLKELYLRQLPDLEEWWIERGAMHVLCKLHVQGCRKLTRVPEGLKFITSLHQLSFQHMADEFDKRVFKGGEDTHLIQHVPRVTISY